MTDFAVIGVRLPADSLRSQLKPGSGRLFRNTIRRKENHVGFWHRAKVVLGLADDYDEGYGDHDRYEDDYEDGREDRGYESPYADSTTSVRRVDRGPEPSRMRDSGGWERGSSSGREGLRAVSSQWGEPEQPSVPQVKMHITEPRSFGEAQTIADKLKANVPVIMNLTSTDPDLAKRLIDFASGLTYGLDGGMQKVADRVFMLTPANVSVSAQDRQRLRDKGLFSIDG